MHKLNSLALVFGIFITVASQGSQHDPVKDRMRSRHEPRPALAELEFSGAKRRFLRVHNFHDFVDHERLFRYTPDVQLYSLKSSLMNKCAVPNGDIYLRFKPGVSRGERQLLLLAHGLTLVADYRVSEHHYYRVRCDKAIDPVKVAEKMQAASANRLALAEPDFDGVLRF